MMIDSLNRIIKKWKDDKIPVRKGAALDDIAKFEAKYKVVLPSDVREYFMMVDGTGDHATEKWFFRFWPLAEIRPVFEELGEQNSERFSYPDCFVFADHLISSWDYAVKLTQDPNQPAPVYQVCGYRPGEAMFGSFREFMSRYAEDDTNII